MIKNFNEERAMNPTKYDIFLKVWQTKSFTKAAEYYHYTQSAVSQIIHSMEQETGVTLFHRTTNGIILSYEGELLLPSIQEIALAHTHFEEQIGAIHNNQHGLVRIGGYISMSCFWIPALVDSFNKLYPNISFEFYQEDDLRLLEWLKNGVIDFAFICDPHKREFNFYKLFEDPFVLVLPENYPLEEKEIYYLGDFKEENFICIDVGYSKYLKKMFKSAGFSPVVKYQPIEDASTMAFVERGFGIALMPRFVISRSPYRIKYIEPAESVTRHIGITSRKKDMLSWSQKTFLQYAKKFTPPDLLL